jgi:GDP/UDP-N,N'-diacetylbacillosamine 2-epimerase (hydrolysing)|tara:strand:- start:398 stop:1558 length:1161 start_codon:yes stop_codon:yes gene_type:complete
MKICTVTGSRAEFFILKGLILKIQKEKKIKHNLLVTGSHNSDFFGKTINDIKKNKIIIKNSINLNIKGDKPNDIAKYLATGIQKFSKKLLEIKPDLLLILGDRYEIYSAVIAAYLNQIPIAHIYGGETTQGSLDEGIRHSISKLSNIHFVSTRKYLNRVRQLGENKKFIFNVGSMGVEAIKKHKLIKRKNIEKLLNLKLDKKNILMTFHPETSRSKKENLINLNKFLNCLKKLKKTSIIITMSGADHHYKAISSILNEFSKKNKNVFVFKSLGHDYYFSLCRVVDLMIGNSSSGIIEMPSFKKGTINVGIRQLGRIQAKSIINVDFSESEILRAIKKIYSKNFIKLLKRVNNPYDKNNSSGKILKILKSINLKKIQNKSFFDYRLL